MSAGHTPGPWTTDAPKDRLVGVTPGTLVYAPGSDWAVALCEWGGKFQREQDEAKANARLIAAAPSLYEALTLIAEGNREVAYYEKVARKALEAVKS